MKKIYNNNVLTTFLLLQPVIDMITGIMKANFTLSISVAMVIRFLFLLYTFIYIIKNRDKKILIYLGLWVLYLAINITGNFLLKDSFSIVSHIKDLIHMVYFPIILLFFYLYFKNHKDIDNKIFTKVSLIIGISFIISLITKTSFCSYDEYEVCLPRGYLGYFFSANEYGSILLFLFGYQMIELIKNKKLINYITFILLAFFLLMLGTKTSYLGILIISGGYVLYYLVSSFIKREKKAYFKEVCFIFLILIIAIFSFKHLPLYKNIVSAYEYAIETKLDESDLIQVNNETNEIIINENVDAINSEVQDSVMFNGRSDYIRINKEIYKNSSLFNKLFGITKQGNYYKNEIYNHINERDLHDLIIFYGIFGLIIELILPISLFIKLILQLKNNIKILLNDEVAILGIISMLLLLISYMAGHSIFHPAVSIYLSYVLINLVKKVGAS